MVTVKGNVIKMTRGDTLRTKLAITQADGTEYIPAEGDVITFGIKEDPNDEYSLVNKVIPNDTMELHLDSAATKALKFGRYYYDIQIVLADSQDVYTVINMGKLIIKEEVID